MAWMRKLSTGAIVVAVVALAMAAWWSMLAAERAAVQANHDGAQKAAVSAAIAVSTAVDTGHDVRRVVALAQVVGDLRLEVSDASGTVVAGAADIGAQRVSVSV